MTIGNFVCYPLWQYVTPLFVFCRWEGELWGLRKRLFFLLGIIYPNVGRGSMGHICILGVLLHFVFIRSRCGTLLWRYRSWGYSGNIDWQYCSKKSEMYNTIKKSFMKKTAIGTVEPNFNLLSTLIIRSKRN